MSPPASELSRYTGENIIGDEPMTILDAVEESRPDSADWNILASNYLAEATDAIEAAREEFLTQRTRAPRGSRSEVDAPAMSHLLTKVTVGRPIPAQVAVGYNNVATRPGTPDIPVLVVNTSSQLDLFNAKRNGADLPVNLLNIGCLNIDATPPCFLQNDYTAMRIRTNGKAEAPEWKDLDDWTAFQPLASKGAAHLPHLDRHGVYTTALAEEGKKLWLLWPGLSLEQQKHVMTVDKVACGGVGILIKEGNMPIQPPNTLHTPITLEDCFMTEILENTHAQVIDPWLTNKSLARQFVPKMKRLLGAWKEDLARESGHPSYTWPPAEHYDRCAKTLEVCQVVKKKEGAAQSDGGLQWLDDGCRCSGYCRDMKTNGLCKCKGQGR
ncbi:hypothetical protein FSPOR_11469 [Fusarium sporotrichioides]|uniref:JmjC domain-containing protein n=1 Tax=Fusarium sporotrichioides TaxID=5514 RepID=A0A395RH87_FUSSP|nr:hypothetical protein FSPOR_11469 [Fusarium sporotrichioides]